MQDSGLFLSLAEIAGVFVGFGALIAVRGGGTGEAQDIAPMRLVVGIGMITIIAALAPVTLGRYALTAHQVAALSSVLVAVGYAGLVFLHARTPEYKAATRIVKGTRPASQNILENAAYALMVGGSALALIVILLGVAPDLEAALYFTVLVLLLVQGAWGLLWIVFRERYPASA